MYSVLQYICANVVTLRWTQKLCLGVPFCEFSLFIVGCHAFLCWAPAKRRLVFRMRRLRIASCAAPGQAWLRFSAGPALDLLSQQSVRLHRLTQRQRNFTPCLRCTSVLSRAICEYGTHEVSIVSSNTPHKVVELFARLLMQTCPKIHAAK